MARSGRIGIWLAAAAAVIAVLVIALWLQIRGPALAAVPATAHATPVHVDTVPELVQKHELAGIAAQAVAAPAQTGKVSPASDEFFHQFYDVQPAILTRNAARCYGGGLDRVHRNGKVKLTFTNRIVDGEVTVEDVSVSGDTTIDSKQLIDCFIRAVKATHWHDDSLPDWSGPDELVLRPERGMKKYSEASLKYEGDGPDFADVQ